jgi:hypothetical protein
VKRSIFYVLMLILTLPAVVIAQVTGGGACPVIVETALQAADQFCRATGRNQICYGNLLLDATSQGESNIHFEQVGDITDVLNLSSLRVSPMNEETGEWGVAIMRLQASLPDTLPGQNVTFILFGDVELVSNVTPEQIESGDYQPMQSFYLTTGIGDARCREAPESGMLVQTPRGVGEVNFVVNEVEVSMGSTILFQAETPQNLDVTALEGSAVLKAQNDNTVYPVVAGLRFSMTIVPDGRRLIPIPELPAAYDLAQVEVLPLSLLERPIQIRQPLIKSELDAIIERLDEGLPLCGEEDYLPACENLPLNAGGNPCVLPDAHGNRPEGIDENRPLCDVEG